METEGDEFDACVTGREEDLSQEKADFKLTRIGLSGAACVSELSRELLSPSVAEAFLLKLKPLRSPPDDVLLVKEPCDCSKPFPLWPLSKPKGLGGI